MVAQADGVRMLREEVTEVDIADIVSKWTGIQVLPCKAIVVQP